mgnify:CR=1 FL=1
MPKDIFEEVDEVLARAAEARGGESVTITLDRLVDVARAKAAADRETLPSEDLLARIRETGVLDLVRAGQRGGRQGQFALAVLVMQASQLGARIPVTALHRQRRARHQGRPLDFQESPLGIGQGHDRPPRLDDPRLLERDPGDREQRISQQIPRG